MITRVIAMYHSNVRGNDPAAPPSRCAFSATSGLFHSTLALNSPLEHALRSPLALATLLTLPIVLYKTGNTEG